MSEARTMPEGEERLVRVCDRCFTAACWAYVFPCDYAVEAGTCLKSVRQLRALDREHPSYWDREEVQP